MFEVRITIEAPELAGAINNLAAAMGGAKLVPQQTTTPVMQQPSANPQVVAAPASAPVQPSSLPSPGPAAQAMPSYPAPMFLWLSLPSTRLTKSWLLVPRSWTPAR